MFLFDEEATEDIVCRTCEKVIIPKGDMMSSVSKTTHYPGALNELTGKYGWTGKNDYSCHDCLPPRSFNNPPRGRPWVCTRGNSVSPRNSLAEYLLGKEEAEGSIPSLGSTDGPTVTDSIDEVCTTCGKQSILPFFDGVCMWCGLKCKTCGSSWACEHRNSWDGEYKENHDEKP